MRGRESPNYFAGPNTFDCRSDLQRRWPASIDPAMPVSIRIRLWLVATISLGVPPGTVAQEM